MDHGPLLPWQTCQQTVKLSAWVPDEIPYFEGMIMDELHKIPTDFDVKTAIFRSQKMDLFMLGFTPS